MPAVDGYPFDNGRGEGSPPPPAHRGGQSPPPPLFLRCPSPRTARGDLSSPLLPPQRGDPGLLPPPPMASPPRGPLRGRPMEAPVLASLGDAPADVLSPRPPGLPEYQRDLYSSSARPASSASMCPPSRRRASRCFRSRSSSFGNRNLWGAVVKPRKCVPSIHLKKLAKYFSSTGFSPDLLLLIGMMPGSIGLIVSLLARRRRPSARRWLSCGNGNFVQHTTTPAPWSSDTAPPS